MLDEEAKQNAPAAQAKDQEREPKQAVQDEEKPGSSKRRFVSRRVKKNVSSEEEPEKTVKQRGERYAEADSDGSDSDEELWDAVMEQCLKGQMPKKQAMKILRRLSSKDSSGGTTDFWNARRP
jgi:hypothetical protein